MVGVEDGAEGGGLSQPGEWRGRGEDVWGGAGRSGESGVDAIPGTDKGRRGRGGKGLGGRDWIELEDPVSHGESKGRVEERCL